MIEQDATPNPPSNTGNHPLQTAIRIVFFLVVISAAAWAVANNWEAVKEGFGRLSIWALLGSLALAAVGALSGIPPWWRILAGLGSKLPLRKASRIFLIGQLGKYIPGGIWTLLAQAELARSEKVGRARSAAASLIAILISVVSALVLGSVCLLISGREVLGSYYWVLFGLLPLVALMHPAVLEFCLKLVSKLTKRPIAEKRLSGADLAFSLAISSFGQISSGLHLWLLAGTVGGVFPSPLLAIGVFALASGAGILIVIAPAGVGVREAVVLAGLGPIIGVGPALLVALLSRVLTTAVDLLLASIVYPQGRRSRSMSLRK